MDLHKLIASIVKPMEDADVSVFLDSRNCGGEHLIGLYCDATASKRSYLCEIDVAVFVKQQLKVIIEIDNIDKPCHLAGKLFVSTFAMLARVARTNYRLADSVSFIQVLAAPKEHGFKLGDAFNTGQLDYLQSKFQGKLDEAPNGKIRRYQIFHEKEPGDFERPESQQELTQHIRDVISEATEDEITRTEFPRPSQ
jgi:hypothetical protein